MKKKNQFKLCNWPLVPLSVAMLASAVQLEATGGRDRAWVWVHIFLGIVITVWCGWHLWLHFHGRWRGLMSRQTRPKVKFMTVFLALSAVTGLAVTPEWYLSNLHTGFGGFHGKLGFIFLFLAITHGLHYKRFYFK